MNKCDGFIIWLFHVFFQMVRVIFLFSNGYYFLMDIVFNLIILNHPLPWLGLYHTNRNIPIEIFSSQFSLWSPLPPSRPLGGVPTIFGTHCREYHGTVPFQYNRICTSKSPNPEVDTELCKRSVFFKSISSNSKSWWQGSLPVLWCSVSSWSLAHFYLLAPGSWEIHLQCSQRSLQSAG